MGSLTAFAVPAIDFVVGQFIERCTGSLFRFLRDILHGNERSCYENTGSGKKSGLDDSCEPEKETNELDSPGYRTFAHVLKANQHWCQHHIGHNF